MDSKLVLLLLFASLATMLVVEMGRRRKAQIQLRKEKVKNNMASMDKILDDNKAGYDEALSKLNEVTDGHGLPIRLIASEKLNPGDVVGIRPDGSVYRVKPHTIE